MSDRIEMTFWNYVDLKDYTPDMLEDWVEAGMTLVWSPRFSFVRDGSAEIIKFMDDAQRYGVRVLLQPGEMIVDNWNNGAEAYREICEKIHEAFCDHPALYGYYCGEEPNPSNNEAYMEGGRIVREVTGMPIYCNMGSKERTERVLLGDEKKVPEWTDEFFSRTGIDILGYGSYEQLAPGDGGINIHFENLREFVDDGKRNNAEIWSSMLSSAHYGFRVPNEFDFQWQICTCAALGAKAIVWFRLYDKLVAPEYWGSPIDEFGAKTTRFYDLARAQKRFNAHFGEIMARLHHQETYGVIKTFKGYELFDDTKSELIYDCECGYAMLSFFKDDEGGDYAVVVNTNQDRVAVCTLSFTDKVKKAGLLRFNGTKYSGVFEREGEGIEKSEQIWLAPGWMEIVKLN